MLSAPIPAGGAPALQFEANAIRPIRPFSYEARAHGIFAGVLPLLFSRFVAAQESVEAPGLPSPFRRQFLPNPTLQRPRRVACRKLAIEGFDQNMDMIRHHNRRDDTPIRQATDRRSESSKDLRRRQDRPPTRNAKGEKINDLVFQSEPDWNARGMRHRARLPEISVVGQALRLPSPNR